MTPVAAVLAGGASRRFGRDKAAEPVEGQRSLDRVVQAAGVLSEVVVVGGTGPLPPGAVRVADLEPGGGPLQAALAVFRAHPGRDVLLLGCDMPLLTREVVAYLAAPLPAGVQARVPRVDGIAQPLAALYGAASAPAFESAFAAGQRAMQRLIAGLAVEWVEAPAEALVDFDTPDELARVLAALRGRREET